MVFDEARVDPDVQKVLRRLVRHGHEAYLVGGCVRDLLLDRRPKDFDVATSARPEEVRELFRNSRIIGRRFRLVHVLFQGGKVIEVATFRRNPKEETDEPSLNGGEDLLIRSDNVFGEASDDALRRDFTINALFYDFDRRQILDWVGGMEDVRRRVVHTIGDPETRFREDPVRILRALKFAGRLDLGITPDVYDAIVFCRESLALAARPRLSEEILRLLRGGQARRTIYLAWETGVLEVLLPELAALLYDDGAEQGPGHRVWRLLDYIDKRTTEDGPLDDTVLWTLLLLEPMKEACEGARDRAAAVAEFLEPLIERIAISRRYADGMRRIVSVLPRLVSAGPDASPAPRCSSSPSRSRRPSSARAASPARPSTSSAARRSARPPTPTTAPRHPGRGASGSTTRQAGGGASRRAMASGRVVTMGPPAAPDPGTQPRTFSASSTGARALTAAAAALLALGLWDLEPSAEARERRGGAARGIFEYGARVQSPQKFLERRSFLRGGQLDARKHAVALRWLVERYGHADDEATMRWNAQAAHAHAKTVQFMGMPISVHAKIAPALAAVEKRIHKTCTGGSRYTPKAVGGFRTGNTYRGIEVSNHLFGIALDIDPDRNPCCGCVDPWPTNPICKKPGPVYKRTSLSRCWIQSFERFGFDWLGHDTLEDTMHFEFLGDPDRITR